MQYAKSILWSDEKIRISSLTYNNCIQVLKPGLELISR